MLERELGDKEKPLLKMDNEAIAMKTCIHVLERALGAIALELACRNQWRELLTAPSEVEKSINAIMNGAKARFRRSWLEDEFDYDVDVCWNWAKRILNQFELMNGANQADIGTRVLSFSTRRVQEMRVARYLTNYATETDLRGTSDSMCALAHSGDPAWESIWKATIKMPIARTVVKRYCSALRVLFERPPQLNQRRPTMLMWVADRWIRRQAALVGYRDELRRELGRQFKEVHDKVMQDGTEVKKQAIAELLDPTSYVFLADPEYKVDDHDTGRFDMGKPGKTVPVQLSPFGICKWTLSNAQFHLFDDNFVGAKLWGVLMPKGKTHEERLLEFSGGDQPAICISWFDSYWYAEFVSRGLKQLGHNFVQNGRSWRIVMPSETQFEYAARAGGGGSYFRNELGEEVTKSNLSEYAHFGQDLQTGVTDGVKAKKPNAWGMLQSCGNVWKWVYDQWVDTPLSGLDPLFADDDTIGSRRDHRGGSWSEGAASCESSYRVRSDPSHRWYNSGLVLALSPTESPSSASED